MSKRNKIIFRLFFFLMISGNPALFSQVDPIPEAPNPPKLVNNFSKELPNFLSNSEEQQLEQKLETFSNTTSNQIVIVIVDDLGGLEPYEYASKLGKKWGVGQQELKNGIVILVKPTGGPGEREIFISISAGLLGAIPDSATNRIIQDEITPHFKNGNFYAGLNEATDVLMALAKDKYNCENYQEKKQEPSGELDKIIPDAMVPLRLVNNFSKEFPDLLTVSEIQQLEEKLQLFSDSTSCQVVIVIIDDLAGHRPWKYASGLCNKWGIGQKELKNGIVILIKPTGEPCEREICISPSVGLQSDIPAVHLAAIEDTNTKHFKNGNFYQGLNEVADDLMYSRQMFQTH